MCRNQTAAWLSDSIYQRACKYYCREEATWRTKIQLEYEENTKRFEKIRTQRLTWWENVNPRFHYTWNQLGDCLINEVHFTYICWEFLFRLFVSSFFFIHVITMILYVIHKQKNTHLMVRIHSNKQHIPKIVCRKFKNRCSIRQTYSVDDETHNSQSCLFSLLPLWVEIYALDIECAASKCRFRFMINS